MKKSILALGAAAVVGGLGFAGSAQAIAYFGAGTSPVTTASTMVLNAGGIGHELFVPYYTAQGNNATLLNIVNTDGSNGKVVKVRFRGAANSDDVFDFTLYMSASDAWSAKITQGADGRAHITTNDKSCTVPYESETHWHADAPFIVDRFPTYMTDAQKAANTREGYIEILNMADVVPTSALYKAIVHKNGVPDCTISVIDPVSVDETLATTAAPAEALGLAGASGQLMAGWIIMDQAKLAQYSGTATALAAVDGLGLSAVANIAISPQMPEPFTGTVTDVTADPLLTTAGLVTPLWFDFPDMSTPMVTGAATPTDQVALASMGLATSKSSVTNEFINDPSGDVPMNTDWVVSQPTRRYYAAMDYKNSAATAAPVENGVATLAGTNPYAGSVLSVQQKAGGPQLCLTGKFSKVFDREENSTVAGGGRPGLSPGVNAPTPGYCGEVFTVQFGQSPLSASLTTMATSGYPAEGWGQLSLTPAAGTQLPIIGFAALSGSNGKVSMGATWAHRWNLQ